MTQALPLPKFDAHEPDDYPAELYTAVGTAKTVCGFDAVGQEQIRQYHDEGYIVIEQAFNAEEVQEMIAGLNALVMGQYPDFTNIEFEWHTKEKLATLSTEERQDAVRKLMGFVKFEPRLNAIAQHPRLILLLRELLGSEPKLFQDMTLFKPPHIGREKPWHQDHAYFNLPQGTHVVGVWIALDAATLDNGCMRLLPGQHKAGARPHFQRRDWQICDADILGQECVAAPIAPGGCLIFNGLLPHGTPHNLSAARRRAVQYHYHGTGIVQTTTEERLEIFGGEGTDVSC